MAAAYFGLLFILTTAFYVALFGAGWLVFKLCGFRRPALCSLAFAIVFAVGAPVIDGYWPRAAVAALRKDDREPSPPARVSGVVLLQRDPNMARLADERRSWSCDALCAAVLFTPGVTGVVLTLNQVESGGGSWVEQPAAAVFRLAAGDEQCARAETPSGAPDGLGHWPDAQALATAWRLESANGSCIVRSPPDIALPAPDWTIRFSRGSSPIDEATLQYSLQRVAIAERGEEVARATVVSAYVPSRIFALQLYKRGGGYGVGRFRVWTAFGSYQPVEFLKRTTNLGLTVSTSSAGLVDWRKLRRTLTSALDDPALKPDAAAFGLVPVYLRNFVGDPKKLQEIEPGDAELIARLISDRRVRKYDGLSKAIEALGDDAVPLRGLIAARILSASFPQDKFLIIGLGGGYYGMPAGMFATTIVDEARLLSADEPRRRHVWGLIWRQADKGGGAAPDLVRIIADAFSGAKEDADRRSEARAAISALCLIGPAAAPSLGALEALSDAGSVPADVARNDHWQMMLLRIGKTPESFARPSNYPGAQAAYAGGLRDRLVRFKERDCY